MEVGRLTATDPDLGENAQLEFTILDTEEAEIFNVTGRNKEAVIVLNKVSGWTQLQQRCAKQLYFIAYTNFHNSLLFEAVCRCLCLNSHIMRKTSPICNICGDYIHNFV